jgi:hypothetical protein
MGTSTPAWIISQINAREIERHAAAPARIVSRTRDEHVAYVTERMLAEGRTWDTRRQVWTV